MSKYVAVYMPGTAVNDIKGFESKEAAWEHIKRLLCASCKKQLEIGYTSINEGTPQADIMSINHPYDTLCGSEWDVISQEQYDEFQG